MVQILKQRRQPCDASTQPQQYVLHVEVRPRRAALQGQRPTWRDGVRARRAGAHHPEIQNSHAIEHAYNSRSRLVRTLSDLGADITHSYDDAGLPESVKAIVQGMPHPWEARLQHDRLGRETLRTIDGRRGLRHAVRRCGAAFTPKRDSRRALLI